MELWDENGFYPMPSAETTNGDWLLWEFDPQKTETFRFFYDARIGPSIQRGSSGSVAVFDANVPVGSVDVDTRVMPCGGYDWKRTGQNASTKCAQRRPPLA